MAEPAAEVNGATGEVTPAAPVTPVTPVEPAAPVTPVATVTPIATPAVPIPAAEESEKKKKKKKKKDISLNGTAESSADITIATGTKGLEFLAIFFWANFSAVGFKSSRLPSRCFRGGRKRTGIQRKEEEEKEKGIKRWISYC